MRDPFDSRAGALPSGVGQVSAEINVTPMIDVMLVLLILFMVGAAAGVLAVDLPPASRALPDPEDRVTLSIDRSGRMVLEGMRGGAVAPERLAERLRREYAARPGDHTLYLRADRGVRYGRVLAVMDAARSAGVRRIGAITIGPRGAGG